MSYPSFPSLYTTTLFVELNSCEVNTPDNFSPQTMILWEYVTGPYANLSFSFAMVISTSWIPGVFATGIVISFLHSPAANDTSEGSVTRFELVESWTVAAYFDSLSALQTSTVILLLSSG